MLTFHEFIKALFSSEYNRCSCLLHFFEIPLKRSFEVNLLNRNTESAGNMINKLESAS